MGQLIYTSIASLDGYTADEQGNFDWARPSVEVHEFVNGLERPVGTYLYGRRMYETMVAWETMDTGPDQLPCIRDFAEIWRAADKVVYSRTLAEPSSARTRIERLFAPDQVARLKEQSDTDLTVGGPELAAHALRAGLVDECHLFIAPCIVGAGTAWLPDGLQTALALLDERRFANGMVFIRYRVGA